MGRSLREGVCSEHTSGVREKSRKLLDKWRTVPRRVRVPTMLVTPDRDTALELFHDACIDGYLEEAKSLHAVFEFVKEDLIDDEEGYAWSIDIASTEAAACSARWALETFFPDGDAKLVGEICLGAYDTLDHKEAELWLLENVRGSTS